MKMTEERLTFTAPGADPPSRQLLYHPDGRRLVVAGVRVLVRDLAGRRELAALQLRPFATIDDYVQTAEGRLHPDGRRLILWDGTGAVLWDLEEQKVVGRPPGSLAWLDAKGRQGIFRSGKRLTLWDLRTQRELARVRCDDAVDGACLSGKALLWWGPSGRRGHHLGRGSEIPAACGDEVVHSVSTGKPRAIVTAREEVRVIDLSNGRVLLALPELLPNLTRDYGLQAPPVAFLPTGVVAAHDDGLLRTWKLGTPEPVRTQPLPVCALVPDTAGLQRFEVPAAGLHVDQAGTWVLAIPRRLKERGRRVEPLLWTLKTGVARPLPAAGGAGLVCVAFHPGKPWLIGASDEEVRIWELTSGAVVFKAPFAHPRELACGPGGRVGVSNNSEALLLSPRQ